MSNEHHINKRKRNEIIFMFIPFNELANFCFFTTKSLTLNNYLLISYNESGGQKVFMSLVEKIKKIRI